MSAQYFTNCGPTDGTAPADAIRFAIGVYAEPTCQSTTVGIAFGGGCTLDARGRAVELFRISIGKAEVPGRFVLDRREFIELQEWAAVEGVEPRAIPI